MSTYSGANPVSHSQVQLWWTETPNSICTRFNGEHRIHRRVHPFFFPFEISPTSRTVHNTITTPTASNLTLVSQLSFDRLHRLEELARSWEGPMSLALYLTDKEAGVVVDFLYNSQVLQSRRNIGYHVVYVDGFNTDGGQKTREAKWCFVIPAFELFEVRFDRLPDTKQALLEHLNNESIKPFRHEVWTAGHMATDYERWKNTSSIYAVNWSADYEPYVIVRRDAAKFDERFVGFGWNKASFIMQLDVLNFQFLVLPHAFLLHLPHPPSIEVFRYRTNKVYRFVWS
ncbi:glycosyltransferase-like protein LARGE [Paragonimus westermani]|uniref:Glycosyltransferase-like protein LARGE n=1 Tax=Paragonimus westermani TaxID=34504 RepID=A0A5J4NLB3_9TREM|nr:glycosyltransferase-like protein LARGE [Paragonimus westermani]